MAENRNQGTMLDQIQSAEGNPDVISFLADLNNQQKYTSPREVNSMLDLLPSEVWSNKELKFLDPVSKTGVFLREIAIRLIDGLQKEIPDLEKRVDHILRNQIFGIGTEEITAKISRRTLYCSKNANSDKSIVKFKSEQGNVIFNKIEHEWKDNLCIHCSASKSNLSSVKYAYEFLHKNPSKIFKNMKFDIIVGNPPYQLNVGNQSKAFGVALYHKFVNQAIKLNPRYLTMIIPSRWFTGGRGVDDFREKMLRDKRLRIIVDQVDGDYFFPSAEVKGGICYFLWDRDKEGLCKIKRFVRDELISESERPLLEKGMDTFIRDCNAVSILKKVQNINQKTMDSIVSVQTPFGIISSFEDFKNNKFKGSVKFYTNNQRIGYINSEQITKNLDYVNKWKVFVPKAIGSGKTSSDVIKPILADNNSCCSQTYICIGPFENKEQAENAITFIKTKFFHFMLGIKKITQDAMRGTYMLTPLEDFNESWSDEKLFSKYDLSQSQIKYIESSVRDEVRL